MNIFKLPGGLLLTLAFVTGCSGPRPNASGTDSVSIGGAKQGFARYGTCRVHFLSVGHGTNTLVFIHGWACNARFWREQVPAMSARARLILIDLPGHGESDKPRTEYTLDFFAGAVLAVMKEAGVKQATLVGHSMGAPILCRVYALAPERVRALVPVDGLLRRPRMTPEQIEQFTGAYRTPEYREQARRFVASMFPNPGTEALRDQVTSEMLATPQYVMSGAMDGMFDPRQPSWELAKVNVPILVINASNPLWTPEYEAYVRSLSARTEYRTIEGPGHFLMLERPAEFNAALAEMLGKYGLIAN